MDTNLIEAKKALEKAEAKFKSGDPLGAIQLALKAKRLFPNLHGLAAHLESLHIHSAFDPKSPNRTDWYAILNVKHSSDLETIRKRLKEFRALTHPDKNSSSDLETIRKRLKEFSALTHPDKNSSSDLETIRKRLKEFSALTHPDKNSSSDLETIRKRLKEFSALTHPDKNSSSDLETIRKRLKEFSALTHPDKNSSSDLETICKRLKEFRALILEETKCPDCGRQCVYIDSLGTVFECKRCKLIAMRGGREEIVMVIRDGFARIDVNGELNTNINVHGGDTTVNGVKGVHVYGGESILLTRCKGVELKGGDSIHMSNCTQININGSGNISYE